MIDNLVIAVPAAALVGGALYFVLAGSDSTSDTQLNMEAENTLSNLIRSVEDSPKHDGEDAVWGYLEKLQELFWMVCDEHPSHELAQRLRWIIEENMVCLLPTLTNSESGSIAIAPFQEQLNELAQLYAEGKLGEAAKRANQEFNWQLRDYSTL